MMETSLGLQGMSPVLGPSCAMVSSPKPGQPKLASPRWTVVEQSEETGKEKVTATGTCVVLVVAVVVALADVERGPRGLAEATTLEFLGCMKPGMLE